MFVFLLGLFVHLFMPAYIVIQSTLKIEKSYNNYKLEIEQVLIQTIATMNSNIYGNKLQAVNHPVRSMFRMFDIENKY